MNDMFKLIPLILVCRLVCYISSLHENEINVYQKCFEIAKHKTVVKKVVIIKLTSVRDYSVEKQMEKDYNEVIGILGEELTRAQEGWANCEANNIVKITNHSINPTLVNGVISGMGIGVNFKLYKDIYFGPNYDINNGNVYFECMFRIK